MTKLKVITITVTWHNCDSTRDGLYILKRLKNN